MLLPTGTVTFLFTDIQGSAKLWEAHPETMRTALAQHDALLHQAINATGGVVFKTVGDGCYAAFASASDALAAVVQAQRLLQQQPWHEATPIRVRMALHTGVAEQRDSDYFGTVLNRTARLLAIGHGGQTLLSAATYELLRDQLPNTVSLNDLGLHRLKDLERPEQVYQVVHPDLPDAFPPLRSLNNKPNNLPQQLTRFIGRETVMDEVQTLLGTTRLLTLTGSGGTGKTRLALQTVANVLDEYTDGVWLVELAALTDPTLVPQSVASALGIKEQSGKSLQQSLIEYLTSRRLLLLLDNCEHLLAACAQLAAALLRACPDSRVLATSREPLGIGGEQTYRVPSLSLPDPRLASLATPASLNQYEAVRLFIERALLVKPAFVVTNQSAPALAEICHRLDGIPLAIELAAARVRLRSVEEINDNLDNRFRLLTGGDRSALPRQQTLRALVDWSYDLLTEPEKVLLWRLSVFAGGWTLSAAEAVCGFAPIEDFEVLDLLTSLVDKSLVQVEEDEASGMTRFGMLETLRQYAAEKRDESGETVGMRERHQDCFVSLVEAAEPQLVGPDQAAWLTRLEVEHDNLRAALDSCRAPVETGTGDEAEAAVSSEAVSSEAGLRLSGALAHFWIMRGYLYEGREYLARELNSVRLRKARATGAVAKALKGAGGLANYQGDYVMAQSLYEESLIIYRELDDKYNMTTSLNNLGVVAYNKGDYAAARSLYEENLAFCREQGDKKNIANSLNNLGVIANDQGDYAAALSLYEESLALRRELGDKQSIAMSLNNRGAVFHNQNDYTAARSQYEESLALRRTLGEKRGIAYSLLNLGSVANDQGDYVLGGEQFEESLALFRELGDKRGTAYALDNLGLVARNQGNYAAARSLHTESLALRREFGDKQGMANSVNNLGLIASDQGDYATAQPLHEESIALFRELGDKRGLAYALDGLAAVSLGISNTYKAVLLWGATATLREHIGSPLLPREHAKINEQLEQARSGLKAQGEGAFAAAWEKGRGLTWEQAVEYALGRAAIELN